MLTLNRNLKKINLSGNRFTEADAGQLVEAFEVSLVRFSGGMVTFASALHSLRVAKQDAA
jgi:hypothetical protein